MATSTSTFPSLAVPAADDTMDMSSPANRALDDDIEIDFDDPPGGVVTLTDDEQMIEDTTRPATATDDMMDDDVQQGEISYEEVMQDDGVQVHLGTEQQDDDELIDYGDDEEAIVEDTEIAIAEEVPSITFEEAPHAHPQEVLETATEQAAQISDNTTSTEHVSGQGAEIEADEATRGLDDPIYILSEEAQADLSTEAAAQEEAPEQSYEEHHEDEGTAEEGDADGQPLSVNTTYLTTTSGPDTPTDTGLHPMTVRFGELHIPLFKSKRQLDGLLKNDNMASVSLVDLMSDCRQQLRKRELDIPDSHSVVLGFDQLGLILSDESSSSSAYSLNEILETYLQLHHNEGWQEIEPLSLTVSTQLKFSSTFNMLKNAAALGQGISEFSTAHANAEGDLEQSYLEEGGDWYDPTADEHDDYGSDERYEDTAQDSGSGQVAPEQRDDAGDSTDLPEEEHGEDNGEAHQPQEPEQEYYYDENEQLDHAAHPGEAAEALEALAGDSTDTGHYAHIQHLQAAEGGQAAQPAVTEEHSASTASSATIQGDQEPTTTDNTGSKDRASQRAAADTTTNSDALDQALPTEYDAADQQHPGSEGWINYEGEHEDYSHHLDGQNGQGQEEDYTNTHLDTQHEYEEVEDEDEDEDENHPDYLPHDEEDQFHTAHEGFGDGDFYEHGLEHTKYHEDAGETEHVEEEEEFDDTVLIHPQGDEEAHYDDDVSQQHPADDFEDEIDFGEDDDEVAEQHSPPAAPLANSTGLGGSPKGKRSFDEVDGFDDSERQRHEAKKSRPS